MEASIRSGSKSKCISLRINSELEATLRKQAFNNNMSLNAYAVKILRKGLEWEPISDQFDLLTISKQVFVLLLQEIGEQRLIEIAHKGGASFINEVGHALYGGANYNIFKRVLEFFTKYLHSWQFSNSHQDNESDIFVIRHGLNCRQWSLFSAESIKKYAKDLDLTAKYEITDNAIMIKMPREKK